MLSVSCATLIILLSFVAKIRSTELAVKRPVNSQYSKDAFTDKVVHKLVNKMVDSVHKAGSVYHEDLDDTTLAKPGHSFNAPQQRLNLQQKHQQFPSTSRSFQSHDLSTSLPYKNLGYGAPRRSHSMLRAARATQFYSPMSAGHVRSRARPAVPPAGSLAEWTEKLKRVVRKEVSLTKELARELARQTKADPKKVAAAGTIAGLALAAGSELLEASAAASAGRWAEVVVKAVSAAVQLTAEQANVATAAGTVAGTTAVAAGTSEGAAVWSAIADSWQVVEGMMDAGMNTWRMVHEHHEFADQQR